MRQLLPGLGFAILWASAAVATKFGIQSVDPLILANMRFLLAGVIMLLFAATRKNITWLPRGTEWKQIMIFALLNTTIYLGAFALAMARVSAGIGTLATATNPLFIMVLSALVLKRKLQRMEIVGVILGITGVILASYPQLRSSHASAIGIFILLAAMLSTSAATIHYARTKWRLTNLVINGWQFLVGGIFLLPITLLMANFHHSNMDTRFWLSLFWLIIPCSIAAVQLWLYLVRKDTVRASLWLFLCPIFGFVYAYILLGEPITLFTFAGTGLVIIGLYLAQRKKWTQ